MGGKHALSVQSPPGGRSGIPGMVEHGHSRRGPARIKSLTNHPIRPRLLSLRVPETLPVSKDRLFPFLLFPGHARNQPHHPSSRLVDPEFQVTGVGHQFERKAEGQRTILAVEKGDLPAVGGDPSHRIFRIDPFRLHPHHHGRVLDEHPVHAAVQDEAPLEERNFLLPFRNARQKPIAVHVSQGETETARPMLRRYLLGLPHRDTGLSRRPHHGFEAWHDGFVAGPVGSDPSIPVEDLDGFGSADRPAPAALPDELGHCRGDGTEAREAENLAS